MAIMSKEYYADIESVYKKPEDYELAGKGNAYIRIDAEAKVTGTAVYTDDVYLPGMYYCKLVHSPYAHALIKSIDFSEALKVPGVKGVLTGADFPEGHNLGNPEAFKELADKEPLCRKKVRMVGDEVAAVCATTEEIATYRFDNSAFVHRRNGHDAADDGDKRRHRASFPCRVVVVLSAGAADCLSVRVARLIHRPSADQKNARHSCRSISFI